MQLQATGLQRRTSIIRDRRTHCRAVAPHRLGLLVLPLLHLTLDGPDTPHLFLEFLLGVAVCLVDGPGCLTQVVKVA